MILSGDTELEAPEIISYYARRWTIEVFSKEAKKLLYIYEQ